MLHRELGRTQNHKEADATMCVGPGESQVRVLMALLTGRISSKAIGKV